MAIDLDKLEKLAREATPGPWRRGYTLLTGVTRRWSANAIRENDAVEGRRIFSQFTTEDEGRSRVLVAAQADDANAEYIAAANPAVVLELIGELREANTLRGEIPSRFENLPLKQAVIATANLCDELFEKLTAAEAALREAREALRPRVRRIVIEDMGLNCWELSVFDADGHEFYGATSPRILSHIDSLLNEAIPNEWLADGNDLNNRLEIANDWLERRVEAEIQRRAALAGGKDATNG